jgi:zinc transporter ZupT
MAFSTNTHGYNILVAGLIIGLVTAYSGFIIPALYLAKLHLRKKQVKILFILSGCLELILGAVGFFYFPRFGIYLGYDPTIAQIMMFVVFGLVTIGFYFVIVGIASLFFAKPKKQ